MPFHSTCLHINIDVKIKVCACWISYFKRKLWPLIIGDLVSPLLVTAFILQERLGFSNEMFLRESGPLSCTRAFVSLSTDEKTRCAVHIPLLSKIVQLGWRRALGKPLETLTTLATHAFMALALCNIMLEQIFPLKGNHNARTISEPQPQTLEVDGLQHPKTTLCSFG